MYLLFSGLVIVGVPGRDLSFTAALSVLTGELVRLRFPLYGEAGALSTSLLVGVGGCTMMVLGSLMASVVIGFRSVEDEAVEGGNRLVMLPRD